MDKKTAITVIVVIVLTLMLAPQLKKLPLVSKIPTV
jgi:hypothetical protein